MAMGQNLWLHIGLDEHPFASYFDVHQEFGLGNHGHIFFVGFPWLMAIPDPKPWESSRVLQAWEEAPKSARSHRQEPRDVKTPCPNVVVDNTFKIHIAYLNIPSPLKMELGEGVTPGIPFMVPFSVYGEDEINGIRGPPTPPPAQGRDKQTLVSNQAVYWIIQVPSGSYTGERTTSAGAAEQGDDAGCGCSKCVLSQSQRSALDF